MIITISGTILLVASAYDLLGEKNLPIPITVACLLVSIASVFLGPALFVFTFSEQRRKKITNRSLIFSLFLILVGLTSTKLHLIGARIEIILGVLLLCLFYGSLAFKGKYEKWKIYARSKFDAFFLSLFDFLGIGCLFLGFLFKFQRWPFADVLTTVGLITLAIGVLAWNQKFKKEVVFRKETEDQLKISLEQIELQHQELEEKQKEIIDSITYARRIQRSLLPTDKHIDQSIKRLKNKGR